MARPVVLSPDAATGIDACSNTQFLIAETDAAFVANLLRLAEEPQTAASLGQQARRFVLEHMSWPAMLADLPRLVGIEEEAPRDAA